MWQPHYCTQTHRFFASFRFTACALPGEKSKSSAAPDAVSAPLQQQHTDGSGAGARMLITQHARLDCTFECIRR